MRLILHLLALVALLVAPLAAPAAAMSVEPARVECNDLSMDMAGHDMPADDHGQGKACCIAVPPAIDSQIVGIHASAPIGHLEFVAAIAPFRLGAGPKAEDPPPRIA